MTFHIITIFPKIFDSYFNEGIVARAVKKGVLKIKIHDLRDFTSDKHRKVDDTPYGGGPGMVLKIEPIWRCVQSLKSKYVLPAGRQQENQKSKVILFSAKGKKYGQKKAVEYSKLDHLIMICGRYEGVDERVAENLADEEVSIGDYILTGGEIPAMAVIDSVGRLLEGALGNPRSLDSETFSAQKGKEIVFDYPVYTKPEKFKNWKVPEVLLGGNHREIQKWRAEKMKNKE